MLKKGHTIGLVKSWVVMQAEQSQTPERRKEDLQSLTGRINDTNTHIGGGSVGDTEKAGRKVYSLWKKDNFTKPKKKSVNLSMKVFS